MLFIVAAVMFGVCRWYEGVRGFSGSSILRF